VFDVWPAIPSLDRQRLLLEAMLRAPSLKPSAKASRSPRQ
jgi:hypothetical protein